MPKTICKTNILAPNNPGCRLVGYVIEFGDEDQGYDRLLDPMNELPESPWPVVVSNTLDEFCSRHHAPAADPQNTAYPGQGCDIPSTVKSPDVSDAQETRSLHPAEKAALLSIYRQPDTPIDTAKTAMPEPVPPRTLEGDSEPSHNGTQKQHPPMVEAVARALCRADGPDPNEPKWEDKYWIAYTGAAWNVIKAIRLPTDPMLERGNEELASGAYGVWRAMFDAVLVN